MSTRRFSSIAGVGALAATLALLAGCGPEPEPSPSPTASPSGSASPGPTIPGPTIAPTSPSPTPAAGQALRMDCDALVSPDAVYSFNPNFGLVDDWTPSEGSLGQRALAANGVACRWVGSGSSVLEVSAARPGAAGLAAVRDLAAGGTATPYGEESWFGAASSGHGRLIVISGTTWLAIVSDYLGEPGDADVVVDAAMAALGID